MNTQLARLRNEESMSKPPDIEALEEDKEKSEEELADIEAELVKLEENFKSASEVSICILCVFCGAILDGIVLPLL